MAAVDGADVFPSGQETAEGAACDFRRAYVHLDGELMRKVCFAITPGSPERDAYNNSIDETITTLDVAKANKRPMPHGLVKVYKARPLSSANAQKYGAEELRLTSVMFVDVRVAQNAGEPGEVRRVLVVRDEGSGLWYVVPRAELFPKLSEGLDGESASVEEWKRSTP